MTHQYSDKKSTSASIKWLKHKLVNTVKQPMTLFWRLFLSMLTVLLLTSALSVGIERWITTKEINNRMQLQVERLVEIREAMAQTLKTDSLDSVKSYYRDNRWLMSQIHIIDDQGQIILPRSEHHRPDNGSDSHRENPTNLPQDPNQNPHPNHNEGFNQPEPNHTPPVTPVAQNVILPLFSKDKPLRQQISTDSDTYPQLQDVTVTAADGNRYTIQLQPRLSVRDVIDLRKNHTTIRIGLILLFSILVCYWLSRALTRRIHDLQKAVHLMSEGRLKAGESLANLGNDELGLLAKDVAKLSTRLTDSELARKQMLSDISHELRSPLARLDVATELTRDFAPQASNYLDRIEKESTRMNELIEHIIRIQSLQMRQYTLDIEAYQPVDVYTLLDEIREDVCFEFQDKSVTWRWQLPESSDYGANSITHDNLSVSSTSPLTISPLTIMGDPTQLHSAFENIIRNAFTHTASGSEVVVAIKRIEQNHSQPAAISIQVTDCGNGVAEADLERIFQPFVRLSDSRERPPQTNSHSSDLNSVVQRKYSQKKYSGYGLGLAIAHAIINAHQGQLTAHNRHDGSTGLVVESILPTHL